MILCASRTSRSNEQSTKRRSRSENVCSFCSYSIVKITRWLSNIADDAFFWEIHETHKGMCAFCLKRALWTLIGWVGKLRSRAVILVRLFWIPELLRYPPFCMFSSSCSGIGLHWLVPRTRTFPDITEISSPPQFTRAVVFLRLLIEETRASIAAANELTVLKNETKCHE